MNIQKIEIYNLYGYMNKTIEFDEKINLLVGINGCGKTSILNIINWLIIPSWANLCATEFDKIILHFSLMHVDYTLRCEQSPIEVTIDITNEHTGETFPRIQADIKLSPKKLTFNNALKVKHILDFGHLEPEKKEEETWKFLTETIPNPIAIGLDRNLHSERIGDSSYIEEYEGINRRGYTRKKLANDNPLKNVILMAGSEYREYQNKILELNKSLNNKIMLSSFEDTLTNETLEDILTAPKITLSQISSLERKVKTYFKENIINTTRKPANGKIQQDTLRKIEQYFSNLKRVLDLDEKNEKDKINILYITNFNQFKKIKWLIKEFEDFERESNKYSEQIKIYLNSINHFLKDSAKELYFDKVSSNLKFRILDKQKNTINDNRDIETLSSGEKQILILFTYIKFNDKHGKLFIIDEPELSLHPKWQEDFLDEIKKIMPQNTQLLFATHSPSIVSKNREYCKILLPYQA